MNTMAIIKSILMGCLMALAAIFVEFAFLFHDDEIPEMHPGRLFIFQAVAFSVMVLLLYAQYRLKPGDDGRTKQNTALYIQIALVLVYFVFIVICPLLLYYLVWASAVFIAVNALLWFIHKEKKNLLQVGFYLMLMLLSIMLNMATPFVSLG